MAGAETLLVTGATGFVMSHVVRRWLLEHPRARVLAVDAAAPDAAAERFFAPVAERIEFHRADILDPGLWSAFERRADLGAVVHGATVTSIERQINAQGPGWPGLAGARRSIDVNVAGTLNVLQFAAALPELKRLVNVSSGSVYASAGPEPLPEDGHVAPDGLYAISKRTGELFTDYAARHLGLPAVSVRLSGVFGPMDRETPGRAVRSAPRVIAELATQSRTVRVRSLDAAGDFIHAEDVADAILALIEARTLRHPVYNVAAGELTTLHALLEAFRGPIPSLRYRETGKAGEADVDLDPGLRRGRFGAYDISRMRGDTGWAPRPLEWGVADYVTWLQT